MPHFVLIEVDMNTASTEIFIKQGSDLWNILLSHRSQIRDATFFGRRQIMLLDVAGHASVLGF